MCILQLREEVYVHVEEKRALSEAPVFASSNFFRSTVGGDFPLYWRSREGVFIKTGKLSNVFRSARSPFRYNYV